MSDAEPAASTNRTLLIAGAGLVAVAALVAFVLIPLLGNNGTDDPDVVVDIDPAPEPSPTEGFELAEPGAVDGDPPAETFEVFNARDPFQQLVRADSDGDPGTGDAPPPDPSAPTDPVVPLPPPGTTPPPPGTTPTDPGTTPTDPGTTPTDPGTTPTDPGTTPTDPGNGNGNGNGTGTGNGRGTGTGSDARVGGTTVTLVDVFTDDDGERRATVTVNGTGYTVGEGDTFARRFRLLDISGRCATMLFGDSRFTLCEGERIRK